MTRLQSAVHLTIAVFALIFLAARLEAATLSVSPATIASGATVTATWAAIASPTTTDWIALSTPGAANTSYTNWVYVSCTKAAGNAAPSGSCPFVLPSPLAVGNYELRLFAANGYTLLATSNQLTVPAATLTASPALVAPGAAVSAAWNGIGSPSSTDWIALYTVGAADGAYLNWEYVSCTRGATSAVTSGSCPLTVPNTAPNGNYEIRLLANNGYSRLAVSNQFAVSPNTGPTVSLTVPAISVAEDASPGAKAILRVNRTGATTADLTVSYTRSGSATNGTDYLVLPTSITIPAGSASADIEVIPVNDNIAEGDETVVITLNPDSAYVIGTPSSGTVTILDDEPPLPVVTIVATDAIVTEGTPASDPGTFTVTRTGSSPVPLTVNFTMSGTASKDTDYTLSTGMSTSVTIPANFSTVTITVTAIDDNLVEGNESIVISLSANAAYTLGAPASATITLVDNDAPAGPALMASPSSMAAGATLTANWSGIVVPAPRDWIGLYAPGAADNTISAWIYVSCSQTAGNASASGSCPFQIPGTLAPGNYELRLFANNGYTRLATSNPLNLVVLPVVTIVATDNTATEGSPGDAGVFTVSRTGSTSAPLTVNYTIAGTASNGFDYQILTGSVAIPAGASSAPIIVTTLDDNAVEGNETVILTLSANAAYSLGSSTTATVTIVDNELPPGPSVTTNPGIVAAGTALTAHWSGIVNATTRDWIALYAPGTPDNNSYLSWMYVSCSQTAGTALASGACSFAIPGTVANGTYELRLFANNGYTRLATSPLIAVTPLTTNVLIVSPARSVAAAPNVATISIARQECNAVFSIPYIQTDRVLTVQTATRNVPSGGGVKFVLNENSAGQIVQFRMAPPFSATFSDLAKSEYRLDTYIVDSAQNILAGEPNHDYATEIGIGDIYIAIGDSITEGYDGVAYHVPVYPSWLQSPIASLDYRNYPQCGISSGFYQDHWQEASHHISLNDELAAFLGYPIFILNEGVAGITTSGYLTRMAGAQWQNRISSLHANKWLVHLGSNDGGGSPTFQSAVQSVVNILKGTYGANGTDIVLAVPQNRANWQPYINNLISANGLSAGPDFNTFYLNNISPPLLTGVHPNVAGHVQMARLWALSMMAPANVVVQQINSQASISWNDLRAVEPTIAGYKVYYGTAPTALTNVVNVGYTTTAVINVPSLGSQTYYFAVQGYDNDAYVSNVTALSSPVTFAN